MSATDFDDDGDIDLFVPNALGIADQLYRNLGGGDFEEIGVAAGVGSIDRSRVALWFDYDNDLDFDLYWTAWPGKWRSWLDYGLY